MKNQSKQRSFKADLKAGQDFEQAIAVRFGLSTIPGKGADLIDENGIKFELKTDFTESKNIFLEIWGQQNLRNVGVQAASANGASYYIYQFVSNRHHPKLFVFEVSKLLDWVNRHRDDHRYVKYLGNGTIGLAVPLVLLSKFIVFEAGDVCTFLTDLASRADLFNYTLLHCELEKILSDKNPSINSIFEALEVARLAKTR